jgi:hypothetical protein
MVVTISSLSEKFFAQNREAAASNFTGRVADSLHTPIARTRIWIHQDSGNESFTAQTNASGQFAARLPDGYYDVLFSASGFTPFCKKIWIHGNKTVDLSIRMDMDRGTNLPD